MVTVKETGMPKSFEQGQGFYQWAAQFCSLSLNLWISSCVEALFGGGGGVSYLLL